MTGYIVNLTDFYSYRLIGKLNRGQFHFRRAAFLQQLKGKVGLALAKAAALRINLNLDGAPIASKSHTHPSHSQTSRLLTSSLGLEIRVLDGVSTQSLAGFGCESFA
jgi:hypothetical protein